MKTENISIIDNGQFKSPELNTATKRLAKCFMNIDKNRRDACIVLYHVKDTKAYEADGFTSVEEYGEAIGLDRSTAYKMSDAGMIYDNHDARVAEYAKDLNYGKALSLASLDKPNKKGVKPVNLGDAIEAGELDNIKTDLQLNEWKATKLAQSAPEKVLPKFAVHGVKANGDTFNYDAIELQNVVELDGLFKVGTFDMNDKKWTVYADTKTGSLLRITCDKVKKVSKPVTKSVKKMTKEELLAALAELEEEEKEGD